MTSVNRRRWDFPVIITAQVLIALQGLFMVPIIVKWAGGASFGAYILLGNVISTSFNLLTSMQYMYRRRLVSATSVAERRALIDAQLTFHLIGLLIIGGILGLGSDQIQKSLLGHAGVVSWWLLLIFMIAMFVARQVQDYFRFTLRFFVPSFGSVSSLYLFLFFCIIWVWTGRELSVGLLLLMQLVASLIVHLPFVVVMLSELGLPRLRWSLRGTAREVSSNLPFVGDFLVEFVLGFSDRYLIAIFISVASVATYQPGYQLASLLLFVPRFAGVFLEPGVSRMVDDGDHRGAEQVVQRFVDLFLMVALPFVIGMMVLGASIITALTTPEIGSASRWIPGLVAIGVTFYGVMLLMNAVALALGRNAAVLVAYASGAGLNLGLNLALLPILQNVHVAGVTTILGYAVSFFWMWVILRADWRMTISLLALVRYSVAASVMGLALVLEGFVLVVEAHHDMFMLIVRIVTGIIVYFATLSALGGFGRRELSEIAALIDFTRTLGPNQKRGAQHNY
jgi:O-antigen/teichoic acid export membrane protein